MSIIKIKTINFKSLKTVEVDVRSLTVITGMNNSGKSSLIQALLILRNSFLTKNNSHINSEYNNTNFILQTPGIGDLGSFVDVLSHNYSGDGEIFIKVDFEGQHHISINTIPYSLESRNSYQIAAHIETNLDKNSPGIESFINNTNFQHISASRLGPTDRHPMFPSSSTRELSSNGQYAAHFLELHGNTLLVDNVLCLDKITPDNDRALYLQVNKWLRYITSNNNINIKIEPISNQEIELSFSFTYANGIRSPLNTKPSNIGFGVSYVFPVLVAILSAKRGDLIIIENPESDLHPRAQSKLGELFALAASTGIQIIVETHSDHIINGIRVQVKESYNTRGSKGISSQDVAIYYFARDMNNETSAIPAHLRENAQLTIDAGVDGFFDQIEVDLFKIL